MLDVFDLWLFGRYFVRNGRWEVHAAKFVNELGELGVCSRTKEDLQKVREDQI